MILTHPSVLDLVKHAADGWADQLVDLGPRNTLLSFKERTNTTLGLDDAQREGMTALLAGQKVRLRSLFPDQERHAAACNTARVLRRKLVELEEEQGIEAGWVAHGLIGMDKPYTRGTVPMPPLRAPLVLHQLLIESRTAAENDFTLELPESPEINPILLYALERRYGVEADIATLEEKLSVMLAEIPDDNERIRSAFDLISSAVRPSGLSVRLEPVVVAGVFSFDKLPMVKDLQKSTELLASHAVIAAIAGDDAAKESLRENARPDAELNVDRIAPVEEFLVHDADSSQQRVIDAVLAGRHVVVQGPPGTGKSQTIANIIATMAARGRSVLFVSEKRAAIEAVMNRLDQVRLDGLIFDLHDRKVSRRQVAQRIAEVLTQAGTEPPVEVDELHRQLQNRRLQAASHPRELHAQRPPWGISAFDVVARLLMLGPHDVSRYNLSASALSRLGETEIRALQEDLRAFVDRDGLRIWRGDSPWASAAIKSEQDVRDVIARLDHLAAGELDRTQDRIHNLLDRAGLNVPDDLSDWTDLFDLLGAVDETIARYGPEIFGTDLDDFVYATAPRQVRHQAVRPVGMVRRFQLRRELKRRCPAAPNSRAHLYQGLAAAAGQRERWRQLSPHGSGPESVEGADRCLSSFVSLRDNLAAIAACTRIKGLDRRSAEAAAAVIGDLAADRDTVFRMPELNRFRETFRALGLTPMIDDLAARRVTGSQAAEIVVYAWLRVVYDQMRSRVPHLARFTGRQHDSVIAEFRRADAAHIETSARRVRRRVATRLRQIRDGHPEQNAIVRQQAAKKTRHMPLRRLLGEAPDVLLAAFPCWAMSPLVVSRLLPATRLFDLVIFDEASQIEPHDAVTSIMRGQQLVVAGDPKQLPPTPFFRRLVPQASAADDDDYPDENLGDYESILDVLTGVVSEPYRLTWHYRSRDERLIAFSNVEIYGDLVTFPGVGSETPLRLETVDGRVAPGQKGSSAEEVTRAVELILAQAAQRPHESLGVITMGQAHAQRIEGALPARLRDNDELAEYFSQNLPASKRFFIKSLESVQGDERDAIILSIGYAKTRDGRLPLRFGPLNQEGGERRLNVAVTRARNRMTVVSSFSHHDMDPSQTSALKHRGPELLRRYLEFVALGGDLGARGHSDVGLNGFECSVLAAIKSQDIAVVPQWGVSGYRIDFALAHRDEPGRMVLAVETDGNNYHRAHSARDRDRLRQQHLENLGWSFHRIWSTDWYADPVGETARLVTRWQEAMERADREPAVAQVRAAPPPEPQVLVSRSRPYLRPPVPRGLNIREYTDDQLIGLCFWLLSDRLQRDREERIQEAMTELGFQKRGRVIVQRLQEALRIAQQRADQEET